MTDEEVERAKAQLKVRTHVTKRRSGRRLSGVVCLLFSSESSSTLLADSSESFLKTGRQTGAEEKQREKKGKRGWHFLQLGALILSVHEGLQTSVAVLSTYRARERDVSVCTHRCTYTWRSG